MIILAATFANGQTIMLVFSTDYVKNYAGTVYIQRPSRL
jgi:hypothetical protein